MPKKRLSRASKPDNGASGFTLRKRGFRAFEDGSSSSVKPKPRAGSFRPDVKLDASQVTDKRGWHGPVDMRVKAVSPQPPPRGKTQNPHYDAAPKRKAASSKPVVRPKARVRPKTRRMP